MLGVFMADGMVSCVCVCVCVCVCDAYISTMFIQFCTITAAVERGMDSDTSNTKIIMNTSQFVHLRDDGLMGVIKAMRSAFKKTYVTSQA